MVALLDDLEDKGYVIRRRHPRDRRAFLVYPTDSGRAAKVAAVRILDEQQRRFLAPLTPAERTQLAILLKRLTTTDSQRRDSDARIIHALPRRQAITPRTEPGQPGPAQPTTWLTLCDRC